MNLLSDTTFLKHIVPAALLAVGFTATSVDAEPVDNAGVTATALLDSQPFCGNVHGRVAMVQFEHGETYVLADGKFIVVPHPGTADAWDANHLNSGN